MNTRQEKAKKQEGRGHTKGVGGRDAAKVTFG